MARTLLSASLHNADRVAESTVLTKQSTRYWRRSGFRAWGLMRRDYGGRDVGTAPSPSSCLGNRGMCQRGARSCFARQPELPGLSARLSAMPAGRTIGRQSLPLTMPPSQTSRVGSHFCHSPAKVGGCLAVGYVSRGLRRGWCSAREHLSWSVTSLVVGATGPAYCR